MIYLDNNSTTKIDQHVYHKQCEVLNKFYGNPSSQYSLGVLGKSLINDAREQVASLINADIKNGDKLIFTSCATESNNTVLYSILQPMLFDKHVVTSVIEHPSIFIPAKWYEANGCKVTWVDVNTDGMINEEYLYSSLKNNTSLVSIMLVNNETGVINNLKRIVKIVKNINDKILIHTDAVQGAGKIPIDVQDLGIDFLTLSGHKFHAPKGVGALFIKKGIPFVPMLLGGHQEFNIRAGTENTASIVAMGEAAKIAKNKLDSGVIINIQLLKDELENLLSTQFPNALIFGKNSPRVGNTINVGFKDLDGDKLVLQLAKRDIFVSSGSACNSLSSEPSRVLTSMGIPYEYVRSIRISLSSATTISDVEALISALVEIV